MGASSGIGYNVAKIYIEKGYKVGIAARRTDRLEELQKLGKESVYYTELDITREDATKRIEELIQRMGGVEQYLHVSGIGKQNQQLDPEVEMATVRTNAEGFTRMVDYVYNYFKSVGGGHIGIVSSIAGTKGLGSAPSYSATKRFQNCYIDALAQLSRMQGDGVSFTDIRPGFVKTDLLNDKQNYPLLMSVERVAKSIYKAMKRRKRSVVIDWRYAILVCFWRAIPRWVWERLNIRTKSKRA